MLFKILVGENLKIPVEKKEILNKKFSNVSDFKVKKYNTSDFETKFWQRVGFWFESFTTRQILNWKNTTRQILKWKYYKAPEFEIIFFVLSGFQ